jgi:D-serine dehydratase
MSSDAKEWKKQRLRNFGVRVIEHASDYSAAVAAGRADTEANPCGYFVDDENSPRLFYGYAVAALRLRDQLAAAAIPVDAEHPLMVYIPCGVGGAPGGICFGLKQIFGDAVHCFFAEPAQAPCVLLGVQDPSIPSVYDIGLSCRTEADGLAVGLASEWVCTRIRTLLAGVYTVTDESLYRDLYRLQSTEQIAIEPSAAAGIQGPARLLNDGADYLGAREQTRQWCLNPKPDHRWAAKGLAQSPKCGPPAAVGPGLQIVVSKRNQVRLLPSPGIQARGCRKILPNRR